MHVAVVGAGSWGTTVASLASRNCSTVLWARRAEVAKEISEAHSNERYLPGFKLPQSLTASADIEEVVRGADVLVIAVPSHGFREALLELAPYVRPWIPVVSLTKGLEQGSLLRMTQIIDELLPGHPAGVLTGPNLAREIMAGQAAASVIGMQDLVVAEALQGVFAGGLYRVYTNHDVIGCEVGGALKNVIAIATGIAEAISVGDNTRALVMTRGLAELTHLGVALGGEPATLAGLAGMGDLLATCMSRQSRNRLVGEQLGQGRKIDEIIADMNMVAEGVKTAASVVELAGQHGVEMPIAEEIYAVLYQGRAAADAYRGLQLRKAGHERESG
ncbi:MAG: NAD(P)H-dependent glycerol-3-phosphate dehydrogenase [Deltaproteobacteria bacterium]|nr:NAD(P)H-dependent glycerol-3-phosphate dehydrogenase [Deltaproteobacteria bacterium]